MQKESSEQPPLNNSQKTQQMLSEQKDIQANQEKNQKKQKPEKEKKQPPASKKDQPPTPELFAMIDMRVGQIKECWKHPESEKLYCEKIQVFGEIRQIASGLQQFIPIEQMTGNCLVMVNLKPRPLAGFPSNGMVVCASNKDHTSIDVLRPKGQLDDRLVLQGFEQLFTKEKAALINPKKKILERCLPLFQTDNEGYVTWNNIKVKCGGEYIQSTILNGNVS